MLRRAKPVPHLDAFVRAIAASSRNRLRVPAA
jgi:hypothetical protein